MATNLDNGPWRTVKDGRKRNRLLFVYYYRGWRAYGQGELIFAPPSWTDEERGEFRRGWTAAQDFTRDNRLLLELAKAAEED